MKLLKEGYLGLVGGGGTSNIKMNVYKVMNGKKVINEHDRFL
jgi:hypothetical protein